MGEEITITRSDPNSQLFVNGEEAFCPVIVKSTDEVIMRKMYLTTSRDAYFLFEYTRAAKPKGGSTEAREHGRFA